MESVTVQQTGKTLKAQMAIATLICLIGIVMAVTQGYQTGYGLAGSGLIAIGFIWFAVVRVVAWWKHG